ncbi:hypothetical protein BGX20_001944 [Mortierella sp. AD010]|nr:hypothetical protein BGX20_001944 [Mortierella sp. AD010]
MLSSNSVSSVTSRPKYLGSTTYIPSYVNTKSYFRETMVADWNLVNFLISGQSEEVFLTELGRLECVKIVGRDVRGFAHALRLFYSVRQNLVIAKNEAEEILNRDVLKGFEHRVIQNEIQASFMDVLNSGQPSSDHDAFLPGKTNRVDTNPAIAPCIKSSILITARRSELKSQLKPRKPQLQRPKASTAFRPRDIPSKQVHFINEDDDDDFEAPSRAQLKSDSKEDEDYFDFIEKAESYDRYIYWTRRALSSTESGIQAKGLKMKEYWNAPGMERSLNKWWRDREDNHNQVEKTQAFAFAI